MSNILGIDVSNNNGTIDFSEMRTNDGVEVVYVKASQGQKFRDSFMSSFYNDCKSNGLKVGAYHFLDNNGTPEKQAENFYSMIKENAWDTIPFLDVETNFDGMPYAVVQFLTKFRELCPWKIGIYTYTGFLSYLEEIADNIKKYPLWEANYNNDPWNLPLNFFEIRVGHQYTESGVISGIKSEGCDLNSFTDEVFINNITIKGKWQLDNVGWWYKHEDGSYTCNGWENIDGQWYLFDSKGYMVYAWKKEGGNWYYFGDFNSGAMKYGWVLTENNWYYFGDKNDGIMKTGWQKIDGKWYYFDKTGVMRTGWIKEGNEEYCLYSDGSMIHDVTIYGYDFSSNGIATKTSQL